MGHLLLIGIEFILVKAMLNYTLPKIPIKDSVSNIEYNQNLATIKVENNRLVLSSEAIKALNAIVGDRITINYWNINKETTFPLIGKSELFSDPTNGNKLTKSNTVSYRGTQNKILKEYGSLFKLVPFKTYFKLELINEDTLNKETSNI